MADSAAGNMVDDHSVSFLKPPQSLPLFHDLSAGFMSCNGTGNISLRSFPHMLPVNTADIASADGRSLKALFSQDLLLGRNISRLLPLFEDLKEEMEKKPFGYREYICGLLKQIFVLCIRSSLSSVCEGSSSLSQNLVLQKSVIAEDYFLYEYEDLNLKELSRRLGLSIRQTERFLKEFYGQTFLEKRTQARMERALLLLPQPGQTVTSVSNALGYSSPEHFSNAFRKYFGSSPKNFLKARKGSSLN